MSTDPDLFIFGEEHRREQPRTAFITGITGQDGSYLAELLLAKGYEVHGLVRRSSVMVRERLDPLRAATNGHRLHLHYGDITEASRLTNLLLRIRPIELYHLAAQSHVRVSFDQPDYTNAVIVGGALNLFEAVRVLEQTVGTQVRVYNAGSCEMFGASPPPQSESCKFLPQSPYAIAKAGAHWHAVNYRESHGLFIANGILFNHESPRRGEQFVTRKITRSVGRIATGLQHALVMGNVDARRDWGFAGDYVEAMWRMLQIPAADDFVIATGVDHSVRDFLSLAFGQVGLRWESYVQYDKDLERPREIDLRYGDASKARDVLGWRPRLDFPGLVSLMVEHDLHLARNEARGSVAGRTVEDAPHRLR